MPTLDFSLIRLAAEQAAGAQHFPAGALYVVATPIGNLADLSLRAIHTLALVDAIACEDTRHTATLLRAFGLDKPLFAAHRHNEHEAAGVMLLRLERGERVAYVSDAGTPGISDPGAVLVASARAAGRRVVPVPGASSGLAAVSASGDASGGPVRFVGFLPARGSERQRAVNEIARESDTQVLFEAPHRIESLADGLSTSCGSRRVTVARELTKQFEAIETLDASQLPAWFQADSNRCRGEFVIVLHALPPAVAEALDAHDAMLKTLLAAVPLKQAVAIAAGLTGVGRNALYERALVLKAGADPV